MLRTPLLTLMLLALIGGPTLAQNSIQSAPGSSALHKKLIHLGPTGKPCLTVESYAKPQVLNKNTFEHWIKATNSCGQHIDLQVCYHRSGDCIVMKVPPWDSKNSVLGIYPMKDFQYDAKEKF